MRLVVTYSRFSRSAHYCIHLSRHLNSFHRAYIHVSINYPRVASMASHSTPFHDEKVHLLGKESLLTPVSRSALDFGMEVK